MEIHLLRPHRKAPLVPSLPLVSGVVHAVFLLLACATPAELHNVPRELHEVFAKIRRHHEPVDASLVRPFLLIRIRTFVVAASRLDRLGLVIAITGPPRDERPIALRRVRHPAVQSNVLSPSFSPCLSGVLGDERVGPPLRFVAEPPWLLAGAPLCLKDRDTLVGGVDDDPVNLDLDVGIRIDLVGDLLPMLASILAVVEVLALRRHQDALVTLPDVHDVDHGTVKNDLLDEDLTSRFIRRKRHDKAPEDEEVQQATR
mmetsp:Transcript_26692/g.74535  ORF Transcript_26692/g.74535 Transcript_26692/m.74535 type:complete len:258 (-) Transcript_26692:68-841(-)